MDAESIREETGYMRYELNKNDTFKGKADKVRIEYLGGPMKDMVCSLRRDIAEDLIKRGKAKEA